MFILARDAFCTDDFLSSLIFPAGKELGVTRQGREAKPTRHAGREKQVLHMAVEWSRFRDPVC